MCAYCDAVLVAQWERERKLCDICAQRILERSYAAESVHKHINPKVLRDLVSWR